MRKKHLQEQENLRLQQAELMALFSELSPDPIFRFDLNGKIILANNSAHKIFPTRVLVGEQVEVVLPFIKTFDIHDIIAEGKTVNYTTLLGENYFQFLISGVTKFSVCQVYGRDITDLKVKEKELKSALVRAEEAKKLKEQFLAQISHEIRSPLNVIVGYSDLLRQDIADNDPELSGILRSIKTTVNAFTEHLICFLICRKCKQASTKPGLKKLNSHHYSKLFVTNSSHMPKRRSYS